MLMAHCPSCGKEIDKPSKALTNYNFTIEYFNCKKCHHNFKVTTNQSITSSFLEARTSKLLDTVNK
jgi:transposase-like protein